MSEQQKVLNKKNLKNHLSECSGTQDEDIILKIEVDKLKNDLIFYINPFKLLKRS